MWVSPNLARSDATRKSQFSASSNPPVTATPLIAPISGFDSRGSGPRVRCPEPESPVELSSFVSAGPELVQVEPGAERGVGTGEDEHVDGRVAVGLLEQAGQQREDLAGRARSARRVGSA